MGILVCFGLLPNPRTPGDHHFRRCHRPRNQQPQFPRASRRSKRWDRPRAGLDLILQQRGPDMADPPGGASRLLVRDYKGKEPIAW
jgi:hypothetical protein